MPIVVPPSVAFLPIALTGTGDNGSLVGIAFGIAIGGVIGLFIVLTLIIIISKSLIRKHRKHKIKSAEKKKEKLARDTLENARREYQHGGDGRLGPIIGKVVDVPINGLPFPSRIVLANEKHPSAFCAGGALGRGCFRGRHSNPSQGRTSIPTQTSTSSSSRKQRSQSQSQQHNWLWWRRLEMTSPQDIETGPSNPSSRSISPAGSSHRQSPSTPMTPVLDGEQDPISESAPIITSPPPTYRLRDENAQTHIQPATHATVQPSIQPAQTQTQALRPKEQTLQAQTQIQEDLGNDKGPNIVVAFWGFLGSWARVERDAKADSNRARIAAATATASRSHASNARPLASTVSSGSVGGR